MYCINNKSAFTRRGWRGLLVGLLLGAALYGCTPVSKHWDPQDYTVKSGDTLYSIAWRYEKDYRDIARWNGITAPYAIYPGQRLTMTPDSAEGTAGHQAPEDIVIEQDAAYEPPPETAVVEAPPPEAAQPDHIIVSRGDTLYSLARDNGVKVAQLARWNFIRHPYRIKPGQKLRLHPPSVAVDNVVTESRPADARSPAIAAVPDSPAPAVRLPSRVSKWIWPVGGKVVKTFSQQDTDRKGIGIAGRRGQAVKAAADGQVVYSGNGLISYGNLVIIKHSNAFLSAYAYNRKLLVKEGEAVRAGQTIANMGSAERGRAMLHFEIRKNGKPVNPLRYLPRTRG